MSAKITAISEPIEFDDEASEHKEEANEKEAPPVQYEKVPSQIRVKPRAIVPVRSDKSGDIVTLDPKVRRKRYKFATTNFVICLVRTLCQR